MVVDGCIPLQPQQSLSDMLACLVLPTPPCHRRVHRRATLFTMYTHGNKMLDTCTERLCQGPAESSNARCGSIGSKEADAPRAFRALSTSLRHTKLNIKAALHTKYWRHSRNSQPKWLTNSANAIETSGQVNVQVSPDTSVLEQQAAQYAPDTPSLYCCRVPTTAKPADVVLFASKADIEQEHVCM